MRPLTPSACALGFHAPYLSVSDARDFTANDVSQAYDLAYRTTSLLALLNRTGR